MDCAKTCSWQLKGACSHPFVAVGKPPRCPPWVESHITSKDVNDAYLRGRQDQKQQDEDEGRIARNALAELS